MELPTEIVPLWQLGVQEPSKNKDLNQKPSSPLRMEPHGLQGLQGINLFGVGFGNNTFVVAGGSGNIVRSTDNGTTWDNATSPTGEDLWGVGF